MCRICKKGKKRQKNGVKILSSGKWKNFHRNDTVIFFHTHSQSDSLYWQERLQMCVLHDTQQHTQNTNNKERRTFLSAFRNYCIEEWAAIDITEGGKVSNFLGVVNFSPFLHWSHATVGRYRFLTSFCHIGVQRQLMIVSKCLPL